MSTGLCPVHNLAWKTVPAGVSKTTGRAYNAFQACPFPECREKPAKAPTASPQAATVQRTDPVFGTRPASSSGPSERTLLILACLDFAGKVHQGTGDNQAAAMTASDTFTEWSAKL